MGDLAELLSLQEDVRGQTTEAISREDWYRKWGRHYMPSLMFAHKLQQCNNFKDPGVQHYGGDLFKEIRDAADAMFDKLAAPKPSIRRMSNASFVAPPVSMAAYNDRFAGCIAGECMVSVANGSKCRLDALTKGAILQTVGGQAAELVCLIRARCPGGRTRLVNLPGGLRLTPHHPINVDGEWVFPSDVAVATEQPCEEVYSFVLQGAAALCVDGFFCLSWAHGVEEGAARHPYFGSQQVLEDVAKLPGFDDGLVDLPPFWARRDPDTGLVCGLQSRMHGEGH